MPQPLKYLSHRSGQVLLIAIGLCLFLVIGIVAVFFVNQTATFHQTASSQRTESRSVAEQGIAYAARQLSASRTIWEDALKGDFSTTDCNGAIVNGPSGGHFKLTCSVDPTSFPGLQPYQVAVKAVAYTRGPGGVDIPLRAMQAYLSPRTLGTDLATGYHTAAALQLTAQPVLTGNLNVHWGPIVCMDLNTLPGATNPPPWIIPDPIDTERYPRKFSVGGIQRASAPGTVIVTTDQKEYWPRAPMTKTPIIDDTYYRNRAKNDTYVIPKPYSRASLPPNPGPPALIDPTCAVGNSCGYFGPPNLASGDRAVFGYGGTYSILADGPVIYVDGAAEFDSVAIDSAEFFVTGALYVEGATGGNTPDLHVPWSAPMEYPYFTSGTPASWPCQGKEGNPKSGGPPAYDCSGLGNIQFRGFLYAGGMEVNTPGWTMAGALLVGDMLAGLGTSGVLKIDTPNSLTLYYDDGINHHIHMNPVSGTSILVQPDLLKDVIAN